MSFRDYEHYTTIRKFDAIPEDNINNLYEIHLALNEKVKRVARFALKIISRS